MVISLTASPSHMWFVGNLTSACQHGAQVHYDQLESRKVYGFLYMKTYCSDNKFFSLHTPVILEAGQAIVYPNALQIFTLFIASAPWPHYHAESM